MILLHGFPEDRHCWDGVAAHLAALGHRVLCPDQRGYSPGARPRGRRSYSIDRLSADVLALADTVGAERFDVVGHDWGGGVAWHLGGRHPERLRTLTSLSTPHPSAFRDALVRSGQALHSWYMLAFQIPGLPEAALHRAGAEKNAERLAADGLDPSTAQRYGQRMADPSSIRGPINWYRALPFAGSVPPVEIPTLYIWSDRDRFLNRWCAERTAHYAKGPYRFEVLAGVTHWLPTNAHERVAGLVAEHIRTA